MKVGKITDELRELIVQENDLEEVAAEYGVVFNGNNKARCPFHNDGKNGNLHLHRKPGEHPTYYCYQDDCRAGTVWENKEKGERHMLTLPDGEEIQDGGPSVIGFVMNIERCSYIEACVKLMERAGIPIPEAKVDPKKERLKSKIHSANVKYCRTLFKTPDVLQYLYKRGIKKESIKKWRLGYIAPDDHSNPMFGKKVAGRLVFGLKENIHNPKTAMTIAMAYRTLDDNVSPKYINDPTDKNTEIYVKKNYLYGLVEGRRAIQKQKFAFVFDGYTEVIIAHQSGIENCVGTCGTSFTKEQMEQLYKVTKNLIFWYDGDSSGLKAMLGDITKLSEYGFKVQVVIADGKDPAEWMNALDQDYDTIMEFVREHARPALQLVADMVLRHYESIINEAKMDALDELLPILDKISRPSDKVTFRSMIETRLGVKI